jgi:hypothetical protein
MPHLDGPQHGAGLAVEYPQPEFFGTLIADEIVAAVFAAHSPW